MKSNDNTNFNLAIKYREDDESTKRFIDYILNILIQNSIKEGENISE